jgi:hypothetical protein
MQQLYFVRVEVLTAVSIKMAVIALTMEAVQTSETSVNSYQSTRRYDPEDSHLFNYTSVVIFGVIHFHPGTGKLRVLPTQLTHGIRMIRRINSDYFRNTINQLIFVMEKCLFFEAGTESFNIYTHADTNISAKHTVFMF